jgi:DNA-binding FadR family transcriptional regulator
VVEDLGLRILRGDLAAGSALPTEADLSTELAVSRTVVREAVKVLASKGLVESRPKTGTRVLARGHWNLIDPDVLTWQFQAGPGPDFLRDLSEVRDLIEPRSAELAAGRATPEEREELSSLLVALEASEDDPSSYVGADLALHEAILRATHNELLAQMNPAIMLALRPHRTETVRTPGGPAAAKLAHRTLVEAIRRGDGRAARNAMETVVLGAADAARARALRA